MIDFLYKFNVLHTALSVIGSEIKAKFGHVGGCWHMCLMVWTMSLGFQQFWNNSVDFNLQFITGSVFMTATKYLLFVQNFVPRLPFLRFLDLKMARTIASLAMHISLFPALWFFAIVPAYDGILSIVLLARGLDEIAYGTVVNFVLMLSISVLACIFKRRKSKIDQASTHRPALTPIRIRTPSARVVARQSRLVRPPRPVSATPIRRY